MLFVTEKSWALFVVSIVMQSWIPPKLKGKLRPGTDSHIWLDWWICWLKMDFPCHIAYEGAVGHVS